MKCNDNGQIKYNFKPTKQELNTKRSTKAELLGDDDIIPECFLTGYFLKSQG